VTPEARERSRQSFIADAIELLNRSLDYEKTLAALAWVAVPRIADWCAVDIVEGGKLQRLAVAHVDPAKIELAKELERRWPTDLEATTGVPGIIRSGRPELVSEITDEMIEQGIPDLERRAALLRLGLRSYIGVPIRRGDQAIGAITLIMAESGRHYDSADLAVAVSLADRASSAIGNAHVFREVERAHAQTMAERDRLALLIATSPMAIAMLRGPDLVFEMVNPPFERTFGGRSLRGLKQVEIDPTGTASVELKRVFETGTPFEATERGTLWDWDGTGEETTRYFDLKLTPMRDAAGEVDGVLVFSTDVTDKVMARRAIEEARAKAEEANRAKDEFLAMLGHELRNPLAPILTALELMQLRAPDSCERERTVIGRQVKHVVRLVDDLLDVSRITRGTIELEREEVDVADSIGKAIEMASPLLEERRHELVTSYTRGLYVSADPVRLAQVVANLLTNAAKYTERGGKIAIAATREGENIAIRVKDSGVGIAPDVLPHVFDTFYQSRQSIDRAQGGLGLGLAIVRMLVDLHGGQVSATSDGLGTGSEFAVTMPALVAATRSRPALGTPIKGAYPLHTEGVLIVDDNADALALLADALETRGFLIHRAHDAPSALVIAQRVLPKVALLDIGLPVMDGYELGRRLRELPGLAEIRLVAVTGYGTAADVEKSRVAGFLAHLVKPITLDAVQVTIEQMLGGQSQFATRSG
jgi:signal transduction histidine kinase/ActR/RegA family two-component response regulator